MDSETSKDARPRSAPSGTRDDIVRVAERLFRDVGYRKTTVAEVAAELGMSPANVYRFFESKRAINEAVAERVLGEIGDALDAVADRFDLAAPERLRLLLETLARQSAERFTANRRIHDMVEAAMAESWEVCRRYILRVERLIARVVAAGAADASFDVADPEIAARCVQCAMLRYAHPAMMAQAADKPELAADAMIAFALAALAPRGAGAASGGLAPRA